MRKFGEVYKEKMNESKELHESKIVEDFRKIYNALLEQYNLTSIHDLNQKNQLAFLSELNHYWSEEGGLTDLGKNFVQKREPRLTENSTPLQKKNFLKEKATVLLSETLRQNDVKFKLYTVIDEMYQQVKGENIADVLSPDNISNIITEAFAESLDDFITSVRTELSESAKINESKDDIYYIASLNGKNVVKKGNKNWSKSKTGSFRFKDKKEAEKKAAEMNKKTNESNAPKVFIKRKK